jgi:hypothetical protein
LKIIPKKKNRICRYNLRSIYSSPWSLQSVSYFRPPEKSSGCIKPGLIAVRRIEELGNL